MLTLIMLLVVVPMTAILRLIRVIVSSISMPVKVLKLTFISIAVAVSECALQELIHNP
jgi:hypothetical protein